MTDSRTPAIAGAGQAIQRPGDWERPADADGPIELMVRAARTAAKDAGAPALLERLDWVGVVGGFWRYTNPGQLVAHELGSPDARTALTLISGSAPQELVGLAAERIARGETDVALVLGGEAAWSHRRLKRLEERPTWITEPGTGEPEVVGGFPDEMIAEARLLGAAATSYALFDDSLRASRSQSIAEHRSEINALWARFSEVAAGNPFAWDRTAHTADGIGDATPDNRMIAFPYTKSLVANNTVDQASALILCSLETARAVGLDLDRLVFPQVSASSHETWQIAHRDVLHETPGLAAAGRAAYTAAGITPDQVEHLDLYACFPAIVQMSTAALGLDPSRQLTITGGLGFAGAPVANSSGQALAAMVPRLREGGHGLIHANGGNATKHAVGIYSSRPPTSTFRRIDAQDSADLRPRASVDSTSPVGHIEAATVIYDREGPSHVVAAVRTADDRRALTRSDDPDLMAAALESGLVGHSTPLP
jgi:acetyl-CoA C-acetyltransferase